MSVSSRCAGLLLDSCVRIAIGHTRSKRISQGVGAEISGRRQQNERAKAGETKRERNRTEETCLLFDDAGRLRHHDRRAEEAQEQHAYRKATQSVTQVRRQRYPRHHRQTRRTRASHNGAWPEQRTINGSSCAGCTHVPAMAMCEAFFSPASAVSTDVCHTHTHTQRHTHTTAAISTRPTRRSQQGQG